MDISFSFDFTPLVWVLLGLFVAASVVATLFGFTLFRKIRRSEDPDAIVQPDLPGEEEVAKELPMASVVVIAYRDRDLYDFLDSLRAQDYPNFEIIIVSETSVRENENMAEKYNSGTGPALKFCFFPPGSHSLSRKKLGLTIGIKAASGDVIVTTTSRSEIKSTRWLTALMRNFSPYTDVVLGYVAPDFDLYPTSVRPLRRFEQLSTAAQWLSAAIAGKAYRGDGRNLAYRRSKFFDVKGYAESIQLVSGEDDIFINSIATPANTRVELSEASIISPGWGEETLRLTADAREQYRFTSAWLPSAPFRKAGLSAAAQWTACLAAIATALVALPNLLPLCFITPLVVAAYLVQSYLYRSGARALGDDRKWGLSPLLLLARPIDNLLFDFSRRGNRNSNFTYR